MIKLFEHIEAVKISTQSEQEFMLMIKFFETQNIDFLELFTPYPVHFNISDRHQYTPAGKAGKLVFISSMTVFLLMISGQYLLGYLSGLNITGLESVRFYTMIPLAFVVSLLFAAFAALIWFMVSSSLIPGTILPSWQNHPPEDFILIINKNDYEWVKTHVPVKSFQSEIITYHKKLINLPIPLNMNKL